MSANLTLVYNHSIGFATFYYHFIYLLPFPRETFGKMLGFVPKQKDSRAKSREIDFSLSIAFAKLSLLADCRLPFSVL